VNTEIGCIEIASDDCDVRRIVAVGAVHLRDGDGHNIVSQATVRDARAAGLGGAVDHCFSGCFGFVYNRHTFAAESGRCIFPTSKVH
jgi:hypothetical protein